MDLAAQVQHFATFRRSHVDGTLVKETKQCLCAEKCKKVPAERREKAHLEVKVRDLT